MIWTDELDARVRELMGSGKRDGEAASILSAELGTRVSAGMINGRRRRLGITTTYRQQDWHAKARALRAQGKSIPEIAVEVRMQNDTVRRLLRDYPVSRGVNPTQEGSFIKRHFPRTIRKVLPPNKSDLCRLFAVGKIDREELSRQLSDKACG